MRVLVLNGSPKGDKSNTYRLTSAFLDGLRQTQPVEAETIEVGKLHLLPCRGCFACWSKTPGKCVLQDDMAGVIEKILAAVYIPTAAPTASTSLILCPIMITLSVPSKSSRSA